MIIRSIITLVICILGMKAVKTRFETEEIRPVGWLLFVMPYFSGGFYSGGCAAATVFLLGYLLWITRKNKHFTVNLNDTLMAVLLLVLCYSLSYFWAADRGMAAWGLVRFAPVLLFALAIMQIKAEQLSEIYRLVPLSAAIMTVVSYGMQYVPAWTDLVTIQGRLSGFFEYPNTFAAYLETALVISATSPRRTRLSVAIDVILIFGVLSTGSRTGFILLAAVLILLFISKRDKQYILSAVLIISVMLAVLLLANRLGWDTEADRFLTISVKSTSFVRRLLFFADALKIIAKHPMGLGYLGYHAVLGSWQNGAYDVVYVHNWILQLLLDVGWIPTAAFLLTVIRGFFAKNTGWRNRLIILVILGHSMFDFDMEYLSMWLLLLPALDYRNGNSICLKRGKKAAVTAGAAVGLVCIWLAAGDYLYRTGNVDLCLKITPFHTQALEYRLTEIKDAETLDETADRILELKPSSSISHSAKANVAFASGDIMSTINEKEQAIACNRYEIAEYCDYFDKLYTAMCWYLNAGDSQSAQVCAAKLQSIPQMLSDLEDTTSALAWKIADQPELKLPDEYLKILASAGLYK